MKSSFANYALIRITEEIRKALANNEFTSGVFINFQNTFNTVDHILVKKLQYYSVRRVTLNWF